MNQEKVVISNRHNHNSTEHFIPPQTHYNTAEIGFDFNRRDEKYEKKKIVREEFWWYESFRLIPVVENDEIISQSFYCLVSQTEALHRRRCCDAM